MNDNRNMLLALVLSALVLFGWSFFARAYFPQPAEQTQKVENGKVVANPRPDAPSAKVVRNRAEVLKENPRVAIDTPSLTGSINLKGAQIDDLLLKRERTTIAKDAPAVRLFSPAGAKGSYFAGYGWIADGVDVPGPDTVWQASATRLTPTSPVTLSWTNPSGQRFEQIISVDENYLFTIKQRVSNLGSNAVGMRSYGLVTRAEKSADPSMWTIHVGPIAHLGGETDYSVDWDTLDENGAGVRRDSRGGWLGFTDKYWLSALVPADNNSVEASLRKSDSGAYQADFLTSQYIVNPGRSMTQENHLFAGAKEKGVLDQYEDQGIAKISKAIDWGWFEWFMRPIADLLYKLFQLTGNFGVAILCLTLIVRLIMYPIADKQFRSMAAMRRLQPKMKAIQDRFKDDKAKQQQEILKLYQTEKVNPAAGCLPILLQIPIFYALYKVLMVSVEMRHQPFALWIKDLSAPDPLTPINLFGLLDFTPPTIIAIGVLPILLGVTMWLQFKLNPQPMTDPIQKQIFSIMPWVLVVIMAPFAAGLQLYWVFSNILSIAQQKWLYHRYDEDMKPPEPVVAKK